MSRRKQSLPSSLMLIIQAFAELSAFLGVDPLIIAIKILAESKPAPKNRIYLTVGLAG